MSEENIKTLLLVTSSGLDSLFPFLFEFTKYWATQGRQLLYISRSKIQTLPPSLGETGKPDPSTLKLMQFMYLPKWKDLLYQLATIHIRRFQVRAIIVDNLADYINEESESEIQGDFVAQICATLLFASVISYKKNRVPVALVCGYVSEDSTIDQNIVKNFFHNVWEVKKSTTEDNQTKLTISKLTEPNDNKIVSFSYIDNNDNINDKDRSNVRLHLTEIIEKIINE